MTRQRELRALLADCDEAARQIERQARRDKMEIEAVAREAVRNIHKLRNRVLAEMGERL